MEENKENMKIEGKNLLGIKKLKKELKLVKN